MKGPRKFVCAIPDEPETLNTTQSIKILPVTTPFIYGHFDNATMSASTVMTSPKPKGVAVENGNLLILIFAINAKL